MATFADNLTRIRKEKGLTQEQLAQLLNTYKPVISMYEKGKRNPKTDTIKKFAAALGCSYSDLVSDGALIDIISDEKEQKEIAKLSAFFNMSTNEIAGVIENYLLGKEYKDSITGDSEKLLTLYEQLNALGKDKALTYLQDLYDNKKYRN